METAKWPATDAPAKEDALRGDGTLGDWVCGTLMISAFLTTRTEKYIPIVFNLSSL